MRHIYKNTLVYSLFFLSFISVVFLFYSESEAKVRGVCSNCHTMHNSQNGLGMVLDTSAFKNIGAGSDRACVGCHSEPRENLLRLDCIGCHSLDISSVQGIQPLGAYNVPQVFYNRAAANMMAAGNFAWVEIDDAHGHNVHGYLDSVIDMDFVQFGTNVPPGYVSAMDPSTIGYDSWGTPPDGTTAPPEQILCAGAYGCHGNRQVTSQTQAMQGTHHADDEVVLQLDTKPIGTAGQGGSPGLSYRFLSGVLGGEDSDWEWSVGIADHNEYYGKELTAVRTSQSSVASMSEFCASCHGNFHQYTGAVGADGLRSSASAIVSTSSAGAMSPWIRHPTDIELPLDGEYAGYQTYNLTAPIARTQIPVSASDDPRSDGKAIVFCLSCHRAHASEYWDILRFSYADMTTGQAGAAAGTGCFACHGDKDGN